MYETTLTKLIRPLYRKYKLGTTVFSALAQGILTGKVCHLQSHSSDS